jgi:hypothetical protein
MLRGITTDLQGLTPRIGDLALFDMAGVETTEEGLEFLGNVLQSATEHSLIATGREGCMAMPRRRRSGGPH